MHHTSTRVHRCSRWQAPELLIRPIQLPATTLAGQDPSKVSRNKAMSQSGKAKSPRYQVPVRQHRCLLDSHVCLQQQTALLAQLSMHRRHSGHSANIPSHPASVAAFRSLFLEHREDFNHVIRRSLVVTGSGSLKRFLPFLSQKARVACLDDILAFRQPREAVEVCMYPQPWNLLSGTRLTP